MTRREVVMVNLLWEGHIAAPVEKVFAFFADPRSTEKIDPNSVIDEVTVTPDGVSYRGSWKMAGFTSHWSGRMTVAAHDERIVEEGGGRLMGTFVYSFAPEGTGTRVRVEHTPADIGRIPVVGPAIEGVRPRLARRFMGRTKAYLETGDAFAAEENVLADLHIDAPVETVFGFLADPENWNRVNSATGTKVQDVELTPEGVGTTYRSFVQVAGHLHYEIRGRFVEYVPDERIVDESEGRLAKVLLEGGTVYTTAPEGSGTRLHIAYRPPVVDHVPAMGRMLARQMQKGHEPVWAELKAHLERQAAA